MKIKESYVNINYPPPIMQDDLFFLSPFLKLNFFIVILREENIRN